MKTLPFPQRGSEEYDALIGECSAFLFGLADSLKGLYTEDIRNDAACAVLKDVLTAVRDGNEELLGKLFHVADGRWRCRMASLNTRFGWRARDIAKKSRREVTSDLDWEAQEDVPDMTRLTDCLTDEELSKMGSGYRRLNPEYQHVLQTCIPTIPEHKAYDRKQKRFNTDRAGSYDPDQAARWADPDSDKDYSARKDSAIAAWRKAIQ